VLLDEICMMLKMYMYKQQTTALMAAFHVNLC